VSEFIHELSDSFSEVRFESVIFIDDVVHEGGQVELELTDVVEIYKESHFFISPHLLGLQ
jgi:hypothetical protein